MYYRIIYFSEFDFNNNEIDNIKTCVELLSSYQVPFLQL